MAYYALVVPAFVGHLNPLTTLGRALQRRGHRIAVVAPLDAKRKVDKAGLEFIAIASTEFPIGEWDRTTSLIGELRGFQAASFAGRWLARFARGILRELPGIAARERFDAILMDQVSIGTEAVCDAVGLPLGVACCALMFHAEPGVPPCTQSWAYRRTVASYFRNVLGYAMQNFTGGPLLREVVPYRMKHRLSRMKINHMNTMPPSLVQVAQQPEFFDFPRKHLPENFHYTGPWIEPHVGEDEDFPWDRLDGRPLIYGSLGTLQNRLEHAFRIIAGACAGLDAQLVIGLGRKSAPPPDGFPREVIVAGYAPQVPLLKRAALVISHGGLNTALECLSAGVPLIALPITNDQPGVSARIKYLGAGEFIPIQKLTTTGLRQVVRDVLAAPRYRERAMTCSDQIRRVDGAARAAELIELAFTTRQPVTGSQRVKDPTRKDSTIA